jgi:Uncharacterized conserved protein
MNANADAITVYGAKIISRHAAAMAAEMEGVRKAEDIEYIHRMRVASRRMRSALTIFKGCFDKKKFNEIDRDVRKGGPRPGRSTRPGRAVGGGARGGSTVQHPQAAAGVEALAAARDPKARPGAAARRQRDGSLAQDQLLERLEAWYAPLQAAAEGVYLYSPALYQLAFESVQARLKELLGHVPYISDPANVAELHAMRISAKRLRYTLEAFDDLYGGRLKPFISTGRKLQDQLGLIHDLDVWIFFVPAFIEEERARIVGYFGSDGPLKRLLPGLLTFQKSRREMRDAAYAEFLVSWAEIEAAKIWEEMMRLLNTPMDLDSALRLLEAARAGQNPEAQPGSTAADD